MSFCFLYNVVLENYSLQNSPGGGGGGSIVSSRSISLLGQREQTCFLERWKKWLLTLAKVTIPRKKYFSILSLLESL